MKTKKNILAALALLAIASGCTSHRGIEPFKACLSALQEQGISTNSVIALPRQFANLTVDGKAYVTPRPKGRWILFRTWRGKGSNLHGYLYTSGEKLELNKEITVVSRYPRGMETGTVVVQSRHDDSWYFVTWGMD